MSTSTIRTAGDVRDEKAMAEFVLGIRDAARARIEAERQAYIAEQLARYPQIGTLNGGKFYAHVNGQYVESIFLNHVIDAIETANR